jgi:hypothetical protein
MSLTPQTPQRGALGQPLDKFLQQTISGVHPSQQVDPYYHAGEE